MKVNNLLKYSGGVILLLVCCSLSRLANAQQSLPPFPYNDPAMPAWMKLLYQKDINVQQLDSAYQAYYRVHPFEKTVFTKYYQQWRRHADPYVTSTGRLQWPSTDEVLQQERRSQQLRANRLDGLQAANWVNIGPHQTYNTGAGNEPRSFQANVYCIDRSLSHPDILYAGMEGGGVYKSTDKGLHWQLVTSNNLIHAVRGIRIHPSNPDLVICSSNGIYYKTTDGGGTWNMITGSVSGVYGGNWERDEITFNTLNPNTVFIANDRGLYRSYDGGNTFTQVFFNRCRNIVYRPGDTTVMYATQYDPAAKIAYFYKSIDGGKTFTKKANGWFTVPPADAGKIESYGGDIAVTDANPNKVYVLLVGRNTADAGLKLNGFIGVYVSNDAGENWGNPHGQVGAPYNSTWHPNLMNARGDDETYNQIYFNTSIAASQWNADHILVGGMSTWKSLDGGVSFQPVGGYTGPFSFVIHPDVQDIKVFTTGTGTQEVFLATDGGVDYSTDFVVSRQSRSNGLASGDYWGFDIGWDEDVLAGGRYHNGNGAYYESYDPGKQLYLGGGETPTGYVNPGENRKVYFSDIGGRILPEQLNGEPQSFSIGLSPNESSWDNNSSRIAFDPRSWNIAYTGRDNKLYKSTNGGSSFKLLYTFGSNTGDQVLWIEVYKNDPNIMYVQQKLGNGSKLWKTTNGGTSFTEVPLPHPSQQYYCFTISSSNHNVIWVGYRQQGDGNKIYKTTNGGIPWINQSSTLLNGHRIMWICHQEGTNDGVYVGLEEGGVFYRNNTHSNWQPFSDGLPIAAKPRRIVPFYRKEKLRMATTNQGAMGIWETDLFEPSAVKAQISADKLYVECTGDTVQFKDHSVRTAAGITYEWTFPGGTPATSASPAPKVVYNQKGEYSATLKVTGSSGSSTQTINNLIKVDSLCIPSVDTIAGGALSLPDNRSYIPFAPLNVTTANATVMLWMKPAGTTTNNFIGVVFMRSSGNNASACGINLKNGNRLGYHWAGLGANRNDGPTIPADVWSHVTMTIQGNTIRMYVNGELKNTWTENISNPVALNSTVFLGADGDFRFGDRYYTGAMDEVSVWNKTLTDAEIRERMHQTLSVGEPNLQFYAQFNEPHTVFVRENVKNGRGYPVGNAGIIPSTVATGHGGVNTKTEAAGTAVFNNTGMQITYTASGNAQAVASRIFNEPSGLSGFIGTDSALKKQYWVLNRLQSTGIYTGNLVLTVKEDISSASGAGSFKLYRRDFNSEGNWILVKVADAFNAAARTITFNGVNASGQLLLAAAALTTPVTNLDNDTRILVYPNPVHDLAVITAQQNFSTKAEWEIVNNQGQLVAWGRVNAGRYNFSIDMKGLAAGVYYLRIIAGKEVLIKKLIKD